MRAHCPVSALCDQFILKLFNDRRHSEGGALMSAQVAKEIDEAFLPAIFAVEQIVGALGCCAFELARSGFDPIALELAAHIARRNAYARVVANAFDLERIGDGVKIKNALVFDKPDGRGDAFAVFAERFEVEVLLVGELGKRLVGHNVETSVGLRGLS